MNVYTITFGFDAINLHFYGHFDNASQWFMNMKTDNTSIENKSAHKNLIFILSVMSYFSLLYNY